MPAPASVGSGLSTTLSVRPITAADEPFLRTIFLAGRPELSLLPAALIELQLTAQRRQYDQQFPGNVDHVIERGEPVGRCWTWRAATEHRLLDLVVLDIYRGQGIGRSVLAMLAEAAEQQQLPLRLSVWPTNDIALRLYRAAGFEQYDEQNGYLLMQRLPGDPV